MMVRNLSTSITAIAFVALFLGTTVSAQQAYQYVNTSGNVQTIIAESPTQAILLAENRTSASGVILLGGVGGGDPINPLGENGAYFYQFVNTSGNIGSMNASSPTEALNTALNLAQYSGVIYVNSATSL